MSKDYCRCCETHLRGERAQLGYDTCMSCGEFEAQKVKHTIVPMHKSNYVVVTDKSLLKERYK